MQVTRRIVGCWVLGLWLAGCGAPPVVSSSDDGVEPAGTTCQGDACLELCGGTVCQADEICSAGVCQAPMGPCHEIACGAGARCIDGICVLQNRAEAGEAYFLDQTCLGCHCADARGGCALDAPDLAGQSAEEVFRRNTGLKTHPGGTVPDMTFADAANIAAWLATLD